jgi:DNA repair protein RecO (recombination protein O)
MIKGVRKSRKNNRSNLFQPLFIVDFEVYHKDNRDIQLVKEATRATPLNSIPFDITKSTQAIFMAEVLFRVVREEEPNPMLAHFLLHSIQYLDAMENPRPDFHILFMFHLSKYLGFFPQNNHGPRLPFFDLMSGQFIPVRTNPESQIDEWSSNLWSSYLRSEITDNRDEGLHYEQRKAILDQLVKFYRFHVSGMGEIRSLEVLHAFFHNL